MKIKECAVRRYGPLPDMGRIFFGQFSLIFGPNESGKTLLVDAIIKMLFQRGREQALFDRIKRVDETPDGYLILERNGEEHKLPEDGDLTSLTDISAEDCRNIFVVRSSDLTIPDEGAFYTSVTDRLTGLHSTAIETIEKKLQEIGRLTNPTSRADLSDRQGWGNLKSRVAQAKELLTRIDELRRRIEEEGYEALEERLLFNEGRLEQLEQDLELLESAWKRLAYESGQQALSGLTASVSTLRELEAFTEEDAETWRDKEKEIERLQEEVGETKTRIETKKQEWTALDVQLAEADVELEGMRKRGDRVQGIETEANVYLRDRLAWEGQKDVVPLARIALVASFLLLAGSLLGLVTALLSLYQYLSWLAAIATVGSFFWVLLLERKKGSLVKDWERIRIEAHQQGVAGSDIGDILAEIRKFREDLEKKERLKLRKYGQMEMLQTEIAEGEEVNQEKRERIKLLREELRAIADRSGVQTLEEFSDRVRERREVEKKRNEQAVVLRERFGIPHEDLSTTTAFWEEKVQELEEFKDQAIDIQYDQEEVQRLASRKAEMTEDTALVEEQLANYKQDLEMIGREATAVLQIGEVLPADTSSDLAGIERMLKQFTADIIERKDLATQAIAIFEDIGAQEAEKVSVLFGRESEVAGYLREITGGVYQDVEFDQANGAIWVRTAEGAQLEATQLSGGTYDQLYLSVRLALADKMLRGQKGFFILDDPFLTSDAERLGRQFEMLRDLAEDGWQIIYFSVKDETRRVLNDDIEARRVDLHELESIHQ